MNEVARHKLWCKFEEILGEEDAAVFMQMYRPEYEALLARQVAGEPTPSLIPHLSTFWDQLRHRLWRKLDEVLGADNALTMMELWDERQRQHHGIASEAA